MTGAAPAPVAVVVPVRDGAAHLGEALRSVVDQVPPPLEVVVVDGGSTDGSGDVARRVGGVRVVEQRGRGLGAARNQGVAATAAELIAFCDSDDRWPPGSLAARLDHLRRRPGCVAVIGRYVTRVLDGEAVPARRQADLGSPAPAFTPGGLLVRRPGLDAVGPFSEELTIGGDTDWFVRLVQSPVALDIIDAVVLEKGVRVGSLSDDVTAYRTELLAVARAYVRRRRSAPTSPGGAPA